MSDDRMVYETNVNNAAQPAPSRRPRRRLRALGVVLALISLAMLAAAVLMAQTGHVVIDGVPVHGLAGISGGLAGVGVAMCALLLVGAVMAGLMVGMAMLLTAIVGFVLLLLTLLVFPVLLPVVLFVAMLVWLFKR